MWGFRVPRGAPAALLGGGKGAKILLLEDPFGHDPGKHFSRCSPFRSGSSPCAGSSCRSLQRGCPRLQLAASGGADFLPPPRLGLYRKPFYLLWMFREHLRERERLEVGLSPKGRFLAFPNSPVVAFTRCGNCALGKWRQKIPLSFGPCLASKF